MLLELVMLLGKLVMLLGKLVMLLGKLVMLLGKLVMFHTQLYIEQIFVSTYVLIRSSWACPHGPPPTAGSPLPSAPSTLMCYVMCTMNNI